MDHPETAAGKRLAIRPEWRENRLSFVASIRPGSSSNTTSTPAMEQSPLTQDVRPDVFEPKIVGLYRKLFRVGGIGLS